MKITLLTGKTFDYEAALGFPIKVVKSPLAKKLTLRIDEKSRLPVLTLPRYCSTRKALNFVENHRDWISETLNRLPKIRYFKDGDILSVMGWPYTVSRQPGRRGGAFLEGNFLIVTGSKEFTHRRICDFLKIKAKEELLRLSRQYAAQINSTVHNVCIKDTKSRWGSCSTKHNINYNWRIILAPEFVIRYLVCHEVSHLVHQNHSKEFWNCVAALCPDYQSGRNWLKAHGKELYQYA